jgi:hypothetical protein
MEVGLRFLQSYISFVVVVAVKAYVFFKIQNIFDFVFYRKIADLFIELSAYFYSVIVWCLCCLVWRLPSWLAALWPFYFHFIK